MSLPDSDAAIRTQNLTKRYGNKLANNRINLSISKGAVFSLLGPNGAGKSTLVKTLVSLIRPTSGEAHILGRPLGDMSARAKIGFLPEGFKYQEWLTAHEVVRLHGKLYKMEPSLLESRIPQVLSDVGLQGVDGQRVKGFSKGMQQRLGIACALIAKPELVFLDEPTSALDPIGRRHVRELIVSLRAQGTTVFLNSHLLSEVESVSDEVAFIKGGSIVAAGSLENLLSRRLEVDVLVPMTWEEHQDLHDGTTGALADLGALGVQHIGTGEKDGFRLITLGVPSEDLLPEIARRLVGGGVSLYGLTPRKLSLEELFVQLVEE